MGLWFQMDKSQSWQEGMAADNCHGGSWHGDRRRKQGEEHENGESLKPSKPPTNYILMLRRSHLLNPVLTVLPTHIQTIAVTYYEDTRDLEN